MVARVIILVQALLMLTVTYSICISQPAQQAPTAQSALAQIKSELQAVQDRRKRSFIRKDLRNLEKDFDGNYRAETLDGKPLDRKEAISDLHRFVDSTELFTSRTGFTVEGDPKKIDENTFIATVRQKYYAIPKDQGNPEPYSFKTTIRTDSLADQTWKKTPQGWKLTFSKQRNVETTRPKPPSAAR